MPIRLLISVFLLMLAGCALAPKKSAENLPSDAELRQHMVYIDKEGDLLDPRTEDKIVDGAAIDRYVNAIFGRIQAEHPATLTVFIHGGLNTFQNATEKAAHVLSRFEKDPQAKDSYFLFIGWQAGPWSNYSDHLVAIRNGERRPVIGALTSPFVLIEDVAKSVAKAPRAITETVVSQASVPKSIYSKEECAYYRSLDILERVDGPRIKLHMPGHTAGLGFADIITVINPLKFVTAPFVNALGTGTWDSLLRRTDLLINRDTTYDGDRRSGTALKTLLDRIANMEGGGPKIDLIGHSMGAIVASNILARQPNLNYEHIVFMGAASRLKDLELAVVPVLRAKPSASFYNLSLDPYRELSESNYYDVFPRGSLLVWIDSFFSTLPSFTDKTAGGWFNVVRAAGALFPETVRNQVHLTRFPIDEGPRKHGDFGDFHFWRPGFWTADDKVPLDSDDPSILATGDSGVKIETNRPTPSTVPERCESAHFVPTDEASAPSLPR